MAKSKISIEDKKVTTPTFRVSFPHVFKPQGFKNQEPKYAVTMLFPADADLSGLRRAAFKAKVEAWGPDKSDWPKHRSPFRNGDKEKSDMKGYKGHIFVTARCKAGSPPGVIDRRKNQITEESGEFYAGCFARATLIAFKYGGQDGIKEGIGFSLQNIQKVKDGEKFSGKRDAEDEFDEIESDDGDTDSDGEDSDW